MGWFKYKKTAGGTDYYPYVRRSINIFTPKDDIAKDTFEKAMAVMTENHIRHLPILDGHLVIGMLSLGDVAKEMIVYQKNLIKELEGYVKQ